MGKDNGNTTNSWFNLGKVLELTLNNGYSTITGEKIGTACEETDALCLVVSEETGKISICIKGEMLYDLSLDDVRMLLIDELKPRTEEDYETEEEEDIYEEEK